MTLASESSSSSSSSDIDDELDPRQNQQETDSENDSSSDSDEDPNESSDVPILSHAEQRRQKRKQEKVSIKTGDDADPAKKAQAVKNTADLAPSKLPKRQNSVWVGNMAFKTTPEALRQFFDGVGGITRIHMPTKLASAGPGGTRKENRGFAYVDFATPEAKVIAITLSENPLDGRRLLIKDGDDFNGRPAPSAGGVDGQDGAAASTSKSGLSGHTKTAQKILSAQKQPAGPTLFLGNLGFEATEQSIRKLFQSHRSKSSAADTEEKTEGPDPWLRKVRIGTFEDSGKCKGWAFVDFTTTEHATSSLINPKNHFLDGRKLVVEYASPDAVRRGGGLVHSKDRKPKGEKGSSREQRPRGRPSHDAEQSHKRKSRIEEADADAEDDGQAQSSPPKRQHVEDDSQSSRKGTKSGKPPRARPKPGAALALAKRETAAIVPSQGKKIVF